MSHTNIFMSALLAVVIFSTSFTAQAACSQTDLTGTWYSTGVSGDSYYGEMAQWDRCKIRVNSSGTIIASGSVCSFRDSDGKFSLAIGGGSLRVGSACNVSGRVQLCASGVCITETIEHGQLDKGKTVMSFVGYMNANPDVIFSHTAIKQ